MATNINVEVFATRKAAESKRREHEHYGLSTWTDAPPADQPIHGVEEFGEGWAVCELDEDGKIIRFY